MTTREHIIDAEGKALGRIASEVAILLCGKDSPDYARNLVSDVKVKVNNVSKIKIFNNKLECFFRGDRSIHSRYFKF